MMVLTDKLEVDRIDAALLVEELVEIYITPTPKGWREAKKVKTDFDWCVYLFIITGVQYLYPVPKHESYSSTTHYNIWKKENIPNLR